MSTPRKVKHFSYTNIRTSCYLHPLGNTTEDGLTTAVRKYGLFFISVNVAAENKRQGGWPVKTEQAGHWGAPIGDPPRSMGGL